MPNLDIEVTNENLIYMPDKGLRMLVKLGEDAEKVLVDRAIQSWKGKEIVCSNTST